MKYFKNIINLFAGLLLLTIISLSCAKEEYESPGEGNWPFRTIKGFVESNGVDIHYILDFPEGPGPFPAVVIGQGSGHIEANNKSNETYAKEFNRRGFAAMRYDKRGMGRSGGKLVNLNTAESHHLVALMADDMSAVLRNLLGQSRIDPNNIGLYGVSQAAWYLPVVANQNSEVKFMIFNSSGVLPVGIKLAYEKAYRIDGLSEEEAQNAAENYTGDIGFDQREAIRNLNIPILYLFGAIDRFHPLRLNQEAIQALIAEGLDITVNIYPEGVHALPKIDFWPDIDSWHGFP